jgi:hypothetical protein
MLKRLIMKIKALIIILCTFCVSSSINAQVSLYEFTYHYGNDTTAYNAFLLRNQDGTGFFRVRYIDHTDNTPVLVEMQLEEYMDTDKNGQKDSAMLVLEGRDPVTIIGKKDFHYDPDIFLFQKSDTSNLYDPVGVVSPDSVAEIMLNGTVTKMKLLTQQDLNKEFVLQYFQQNEDFYVNLFETADRNIKPQEKPDNLFLIIVANTNDASIGKSCEIDRDATLATFKEIAEFLNIQFVPKEISGNIYSKKNVENAIKAISPNPNDIVVFYYSGHGFSDSSDKYLFPHLDLRDKIFEYPGAPYELKMEDIYATLKKKGARLTMVFSDCCNSAIGKAPVSSSNAIGTRPSGLGWSQNNCRSLFMDTKQYSILMTAAAKGEESAGNSNDGGFFTFNFRETMEKYMAPVFKDITWEKIVQTAQTQTIAKANHNLCPKDDGKGFIRCHQTPIVKFN